MPILNFIFKRISKPSEATSDDLNINDPDSLHFSYIHPKDKRALRYHYDEFMVSWIPLARRYVVKNNDFSKINCFNNEKERDLYIEQSLYMDLFFLSKALFRRDFFYAMGWDVSKPVYVNVFIYEMLKKTWQGPAAINIKKSYVESFKFVLKYVTLEIISGLKNKFLRKKKIKKNKKRKIAVELFEGLDLTKKNDIFWMSENKIDSSRILLLVESQNLCYLDIEKSIKLAKRMRIQIITNDPKIAYLYKLPSWRPEHQSLILDTLSLLKIIFLTQLPSLWTALKMNYAEKKIIYWKSFFSEFNIFIYQHSSEHSIDGLLRRFAINSLSGYEFGRMRSQFFEFYSAAFYFHHQIAMVWKSNVKNVFEKGLSGINHILEIGYPNYYLKNQKYISLNNETKINFNLKVRHKCIVFDNAPHHNGQLSIDALKIFYNEIINVACANPSIGFIIKSKKPQILNSLPVIKNKLLKLQNLNQVNIVTSKYESAAFLALQADYAVGIPGSTAVCEASILGCNVIMYDETGANRLKNLFLDKIIFNDILKFKSALNNLLNGNFNSKYQASFRRYLSCDSINNKNQVATDFINLVISEKYNFSSSEDLIKYASKFFKFKSI
jgi:hypothetical protein